MEDKFTDSIGLTRRLKLPSSCGKLEEVVSSVGKCMLLLGVYGTFVCEGPLLPAPAREPWFEVNGTCQAW